MKKLIKKYKEGNRMSSYNPPKNNYTTNSQKAALRYIFNLMTTKPKSEIKNPNPIIGEGELIPRKTSATPTPVIPDDFIYKQPTLKEVQIEGESPYSDYRRAHWKETEKMKEVIATMSDGEKKLLLTLGGVAATPILIEAGIAASPYILPYVKQGFNYAWPKIKTGVKKYFSLNPQESLGEAIGRDVVNDAIGYTTEKVAEDVFGENLYERLNNNPKLNHVINYGSNSLDFTGKVLQVVSEMPGKGWLSPWATGMNRVGSLGSGVVGGMAAKDAVNNGLTFDNTMDFIGSIDPSTFNTSNGNLDEYIALGSSALLGFGTDIWQDIRNNKQKKNGNNGNTNSTDSRTANNGK